MKKLDNSIFPFGFWSHMSLADAPSNQPDEWAELGMTLTMHHGYSSTSGQKEHLLKMLNCADKNNIKIILCDSRTSASNLRANGKEKYAQDVKAVIEEFGSHPCVWGIKVGDEPDANAYPFYCEAARIIREISPKHEPFINLLPWYEFVSFKINNSDFANYLDNFIKDSKIGFLCYDCYSQMNPGQSGYNMYFKNLKYYSEASLRAGIPFWTTMLSVGHFDYRTPNIDDFRWQIHTAVAHGAKGILWYFMYHSSMSCNYRNAPVNVLGRRTQSFYDISDNQKIFLNHIGKVILDLELVKVQHIGKAFGGIPLFTGDEVCEHEGMHNEQEPMILSYFKDSEEKNYIMLVNNSCTNNVHHTLRVKGEDKRIFMLGYGGNWREIDKSQGDNGFMVREDGVVTVPHWFAPGQAILFRYE